MDAQRPHADRVPGSLRPERRLTSHRDALREHLRKSGVETLLHWPKPVWRHEALRLGEWHVPNIEAICREVLSLPMSTETTEDQVDYVVDVTRRFFEGR